ncbi:MAG: TolC family protein [Kofleriaceae bacterium]
MNIVRWVCAVAATATVVGSATGEPVALSIEQAVARVEPAAASLTAAREDLARAGDLVDAARAARLPQVNASASFQRTLVSEFKGGSFTLPTDPPITLDLPIGQTTIWRVGVGATQAIYDGGRARAAITLAGVGVEATRLGVEGQRTALVFAVSQAYWDAALAVRAVEIAQAALASADETLAQTQLAFAHQAAAEFDVVRAQVARDNQATGVIQLEAQRAQAMVTLARLIDAPLDQPLELTSRLELDDATVVAPGGAPSAAPLAVAQATLEVRGKEAAVVAAQAERLPVVQATTDLGLVDYPAHLHPFNTDWRANWTVGVGVSIPLFDGFRRRATTRAARREVAAARARLADVEERLAADQRVVDAQLAAARATWQQASRTVEQARRAFAIAELRVAQGASTHLELVDARTQLEQAELNRARSARDVRVASLRRTLLAGLPLGAGGP